MTGIEKQRKLSPERCHPELVSGSIHRHALIVPEEKQPCVYILASRHYGTIYIGVTSDLMKRLWQHREGVLPGFTSDHAVKRLVHFEMFGDMERAILREKQLKNWRRQWKINFINEVNPEWRDLAVGLGFEPLDQSMRNDAS